MFSLVCLVALAAAAQATVLSLQSPRFSINASNVTLLTTSKLSTPVTLSATDVLKLTFQVVEKDNGKGVKPHQTFLRFYDEASGEEGIQPVRVTIGGKAKFELV
jgi:oligosaccharyltransferase complex subunit delta (ribophorin II)